MSFADIICISLALLNLLVSIMSYFRWKNTPLAVQTIFLGAGLLLIAYGGIIIIILGLLCIGASIVSRIRE